MGAEPLYLLDTDVCIFALKRNVRVLDRLRAAAADEAAVSIITIAELLFGARKSATPEESTRRVDVFLGAFAILPFDRAAAESYAIVRLDLERRGQRIGERDLMIASIAHARRLTVVTHNVAEFARVPDLEVEDWA